MLLVCTDDLQSVHTTLIKKTNSCSPINSIIFGPRNGCCRTCSWTKYLQEGFGSKSLQWPESKPGSESDVFIFFIAANASVWTAQGCGFKVLMHIFIYCVWSDHNYSQFQSYCNGGLYIYGFVLVCAIKIKLQESNPLSLHTSSCCCSYKVLYHFWQRVLFSDALHIEIHRWQHIMT